MSDKTSLYIVSVVAVVGIVGMVFMTQQTPDKSSGVADFKSGELSNLPKPPTMVVKGEGSNATPVLLNESENVAGKSINILHDNCDLIDYQILRDGVMYVYDCGAGGIATYTIKTE